MGYFSCVKNACAAVERGEFSITISPAETNEAYIDWLIDKDFKVSYKIGDKSTWEPMETPCDFTYVKKLRIRW